MYLGELVEFGETASMFTNPATKRASDYITGRFGCHRRRRAVTVDGQLSHTGSRRFAGC